MMEGIQIGSPQVDVAHASFMEEFIRAMSVTFDVVGVEMPWAWFGHRGILDVALRSKELVRGERHWLLCELKPDLIDVGEALRQVKKVQQYFMQDQKKLVGDEAHAVTCPLVLLASESNLAKCMRYYHLLKGVHIMFFNADTAVTDMIAGKYEVFQATKAAYEANEQLAARPEPERVRGAMFSALSRPD